VNGPVEQQPTLEAKVHRLTDEVRRVLKRTENEPVGVLTAYRDSLLWLADAVDHLAGEIDSRHERG
jgi:ERCC4-related helicase